MVDDIRKDIESMFNEAGLLFDVDKFASFFIFTEKLLREGVELGVTSVKERLDIWRKHILDSLLLFKVWQVPFGSRLIDVGSGGGLPGIALKIYRQDLEVTLLESQRRRVAFMEGTLRDLSLKGISCLWGRAEDMGRRPGLRESYDLVVARAVATLSVLAEYCLPFARLGGKFVAYKGPNVEEEVKLAGKAIRVLGGELAGVWQGQLPGGKGEMRSLVIVHKVNPTPAKYPRRAGLPAKRSL
ncbi:MAG: rRNA (guanine527-N7)-methyltransferase [Clostridia bacterium]|nr:rRNA (guanine527-N7)-methyltransferase [Clostridia bacterium]